METNIQSYPESQTTIRENENQMFFIKNPTIPDENGFVKFLIDDHQMNLLFKRFEINNLRNDFCILAIKNLLKKNEFLQLSLQLSEKLITESEFESEIDENPDRYIIQMNELEDSINLNVISSILTKIGKSFNIDEVSELFSIDVRSIKHELKTIDTN